MDKKFRPLRRIKKTGKIVVASYMGWRSVFTANYGKFNLTIDQQYLSFPDDEQVYSADGSLLFWFTEDSGHTGVDCDKIPTFSHYTEQYISRDDLWNYYGSEAFEPLTVGIVKAWLPNFIMQLENATIKTLNNG